MDIALTCIHGALAAASDGFVVLSDDNNNDNNNNDNSNNNNYHSDNNNNKMCVYDNDKEMATIKTRTVNTIAIKTAIVIITNKKKQ